MQKKGFYNQFIILFILVSVFISSDTIIRSKNSKNKIEAKISLALDNIQNRHDSLILEVKNNIDETSTHLETFFEKIKPNEIAIYLFKNNNLIYWNSDINDPENLKEKTNAGKNIYEQGNHLYFVSQLNLDSIKLLTSTPLYYQNSHQNNNIFIPVKINGSHNIAFKIENDNIKYTIEYKAKMNKIDSYILGIILILILITGFKISYNIIQNYRKNKGKYPLFLAINTVIYIITILLQNQLFISTSDLFGDSCLIENCKYKFSLGSLAEFATYFFSNIIILSQSLKREISLKQNLKIIIGISIFTSILLIYTILIYELISNINIPFSFLQIYNTNVESYIFLIVIAVLTCSIIILLQNLTRIFTSEKQPYLLSIISFLIIGGIFEVIINQAIELKFSIVTNIVGILFYLTILWERKARLKIKNIIRNISIISLTTIQLTYILYLINEKKEYEELTWFATVVGDESDETFEEEIMKITEEIKKDENIYNWQNTRIFPSDDSILTYFNKKYFDTKIIKEYNKAITTCDTSTILVIENQDNIELNCNDLFDEIIEYNPTEKVSKELTLVDDPTTDSYYILRLNLSPSDTINPTICYIEFYKEYILNYIGIPEIITSHENVLTPNLINYSFSCYKDDILQYKYGHYNYPNELKNFKYKDEEYVKTRIFKHLTKKINEYKTIIVTIEKPRFIDVIAPFSYIFIILVLMYVIYLRSSEKKEIINKRRSFHGKMQLTIILTLGFSFAVAGITSFIFMRNSLNKKTFEFQYERNKSIVKNLESDFKKESINDYEYLKKYKENYFTDINIFDLNGKLTNTTQPKLFNSLKSKVISREAYDAIIIKERFFYSDEEEINQVKYNSYYFPLKDNNGKIHAIINIPHFDNMTTSKTSMSNFIITYLNIILVLMGLSALVVILMTRKTIKPLQMIQNKMQRINLGEKNEIIEWKSNDEIGDLIKIYNQLIKELEISANKLMRSERETAWREMARQVAHEIKNPLTPMKLNIQFLQMAWDEKNPDIDKKLRETTKSLLEQIDILSNIATAFSNYAKLPQKNIETFNIKELILNTINLYNNNQNIEIEFLEENKSDFIINSDKNNLGIVFGNIIKNAVQAIGKKENGKISITINDSGNSYEIKISDNGCGIGEEEKRKIFMPNFTTKSSGMGVGLSIVYDILETLDGKISFESEIGKGTTFVIEIKR